jgi:hypothetical protein
MKVFMTIETSQPCGKTFRLAIGLCVPVSLVLVLVKFVGLI